MTQRLERTVGLGGAVFLLVGNIVGASIFILPGELAGVAGPAVAIAYLIASVPAIINCLIAAQVGSILPVSAADYVFTSVTLHPFLGFLKVWSAMLSLIVGVPILAYGFADYMAFFLPDVHRVVIAAGVVVLLLVVNLLGLRTSVRTQMFMVCVFVAALLVFGVGGLFFVDWSRLVPVAPNGAGSIWQAAVPAYYSYTGFLAIVVIAEEIKEPETTIPRTLLLTFIIVAAIYTLVTVVLPGLVPWRELGGIVAPMAMASRTFLPEWFATLITVSALLAAATSINTLILTTSRSFFALARNRIYPEVLSRINLRTMEPYVATITVVLLALLGIAAQGNIVQYASLTVIGVMLYGIVWSVALTRLPTRLPEHYANARFRLSIPAIWIIASLKVGISVVFLYIGVVSNPGPAAVYLGLVLLGFVYYLFRRAYLERAGVDLAALLRRETGQQQ